MNHNNNNIALAPLSAIEREISNGEHYDKYFPLPEGKVTLLKKGATVEQTVMLMIDVIDKFHKEVALLAPLLKAKTVYQTIKNIWQFVHKYLKYNIEKGEVLRTPASTWFYAQVKSRKYINDSSLRPQDYSADCDCFSIFICSLCKCLNIAYILRITAYNGNDNFQHVYPLIIDGDKLIIADAVYHSFNEEKEFTKKKDFDMNKNQLGANVMLLHGTYDANRELDLVVSGVDLTTNELGNIDENGIHNYLIRTRNILASEKSKLIPNSAIHYKFFDYAVNNWNTPRRQEIINELAEKERELEKKGILLQGLGDTELGSFWSKLKQAGKWALDKGKKVVTAANPANWVKKPHKTPAPTQTQISSSNESTPAVVEKKWYQKPLVLGGIGLGAAAIGTGIYFATRPSKSLNYVGQIPLS